MKPSPERPTILYVEDDPTVRFGSAQAMQLAGRAVRAFESAEDVLPHLVPGFPGVLLTDVKLPGMSGLELLAHARRVDPELPVILVTGHGDISMAVEAMRLGAYDFLEKPFSTDRLNDVVGRALERRRLGLEVVSLRARLSSREAVDAKLIGRSPAMVALRRLILDIAPTNADVLITGETGTGKELVARCLHDHGRPDAGVFAALNCGAVPGGLFESEVFGHAAGAFTGAMQARAGKIEYAGAGSLFLDEIEAMTPAVQAKLLRVLQERKYERLGSNETRTMACRVIAATKVDPLHAPAETPLRSDLYYRLGVVVLKIPPLRERREDIPALFEHFLLLASARYERRVPELSPQQTNRFMAHAWPGNVRELRNVADRFVLGLPLDEAMGDDAAPACRSLDEQVAIFERQLIEQALTASEGRAALACERLGLPKKTLYDRMKRLGISTEAFKAGADAK
jgi:two-component system, NtrC family, C4-dicarboxylate transport response regulator DctD